MEPLKKELGMQLRIRDSLNCNFKKVMMILRRRRRIMHNCMVVLTLSPEYSSEDCEPSFTNPRLPSWACEIRC